MAAAALRQPVDQTSTTSHLLRQSVTARFDSREDDGELEQTAGPDGEDYALQRPAGGDQRLVEEVEQFHDVKRDAEVDEE